MSSVTAIACAPAASARRTMLATTSREDDQYSWYQKGEPPIAAAVTSMGVLAWVESRYGTPRDAAARATPASASRCTSPITPTGEASRGVG